MPTAPIELDGRDVERFIGLERSTTLRPHLGLRRQHEEFGLEESGIEPRDLLRVGGRRLHKPLKAIYRLEHRGPPLFHRLAPRSPVPQARDKSYCATRRIGARFR